MSYKEKKEMEGEGQGGGVDPLLMGVSWGLSGNRGRACGRGRQGRRQGELCPINNKSPKMEPVKLTVPLRSKLVNEI